MVAHWWRPSYQVTPPSVAITEINYHPHDPTDLERWPSYPMWTQDDFEFLEIHNYGQRPVNLNGLQLTDGVQFAFPSEWLDAGQYAVVVKNTAGLSTSLWR